jgi:type II secretory pathway pseudopilin PulG
MSVLRTRGIALPEVLFAILILGLLAAAVIPKWVYSSDTKVGECKANVALLNAEIDRYADSRGGRAPAGQDEFTRIVAQDRARFPSGLPACPYDRPYEYDPATGHVVTHRH